MAKLLSSRPPDLTDVDEIPFRDDAAPRAHFRVLNPSKGGTNDLETETGVD